MSTIRRSMLFVPGNNPGMLVNSVVFGADTLIYDLEDAVSPNQKDAARLLVRNALDFNKEDKTEKLVRINAYDANGWWKEDLKQLLKSKIDGIMIPKSEESETIKIVIDEIVRLEKEYDIKTPIKVLCLVETALGLENVYSIAKASDKVDAIVFGAEDYTSDIGAIRTKSNKEIIYSRSRIVNGAKAAGVSAIDTVFTDTDDYEGLREDTFYAKEIGFDGKLVISPRHISYINDIFLPTEAEYQHALKVIEVIEQAEREGKGAVSLNGKMIDAPIVNRAKKVIETYEKLGA